MRQLFIGCLALACVLGVATPAQAGVVYIPLALDMEIDGVEYETEVLLSNTLANSNRRLLSYFIPAGTDGTVRPESFDDEAERTFIAPGVSRPVALSPAGGLGFLEIEIPEGLQAQARLVSRIDGVRSAEPAALPIVGFGNQRSPGDISHILGLQRSDTARTDFVLLNLAQAPASCQVTLFYADGLEIAPTAQLALEPLSQLFVEDALGLLGVGDLINGRARISCDSAYYALTVVRDSQTGAAAVFTPSVHGGGDLIRPGEVVECPDGATCFQEQGVFHVPAPGNPVKRLELSFPPGEIYAQVRVLLEVTHGGWFPRNRAGIHNFFWLARNRYRSNTFGYVNVRGPEKNILTSLTNVNLPAGVTQRLTKNVSLRPGETYFIDYTYDTEAKLIVLIFSDSAGQVLATIVDTTRVQKIETEGDGFIMDFGLREFANDVPTYGWEYANLNVQFIP